MDENETVEAFAEALAARTEAAEVVVDTEVMQDMRTGGYFYEASTPEGRFTIMVTAIEEDEEES